MSAFAQIFYQLFSRVGISGSCAAESITVRPSSALKHNTYYYNSIVNKITLITRIKDYQYI